jgi:hypothetical protein
MKFDRIDLIYLINECINEVMDFNNIENYDYHIYNNIINDNISSIGVFKLDDDAIVEVLTEKISVNDINIPPIFNKENAEIINIVYEINNMTTQYKKTDLRELLKILKTVSLIIKDFVQKHEKENIIYILHSEPKSGSGFTDKQKGEMYKMALNKKLPSYYRISDGIYKINTPVIVFQKDVIHEKRYYNRLKNNL